MASLRAQLAELRLIRDSLLPDEYISFADGAEEWERLLASDGGDANIALSTTKTTLPTTECRFEARVRDAPIWVDIQLPSSYPAEQLAIAYVKVTDVDRREQEKWQAIVNSLLEEIKRNDEEYPVFELISIVLPQIHEFHGKYVAAKLAQLQASTVPTKHETEPGPSPAYHALFTSHHLVSPVKRRSMQKWASDLSLRGFAKVGYPGVIYCEGTKENVEEFVSNVKAMQWLALRMWFVERIPDEPVSNPGTRVQDGNGSNINSSRSWIEVEKVGEVLSYMRKLGREEFVLDVGLGSAGTDVKS